jgi:aminopeptidase
MHPPSVDCACVLDDRTLERYAGAIVRSCLEIGPGDLLAVHGEPAHRELILAVTRVAYAAGARHVDVAFVEPALRRARVDNAAPETLDYQPPWAERRMRDLARAHGASISINGPSAPMLMNDADPDRAARERSSRIPGQRVYLREVQKNALRFCVVAYPVEGWCAPVYPELDPAAATRQVAADLASFCRVADADPADAWDKHVEMLSARAVWLNELGLDRIVLRAPGTELEVGMARGGKWCAADETTVHGHRFRANMPTEEVFTSPDPRRTSGTFRCTRPLTLDGRRIVGIHGRFSGGRLVEIGADNDDDRSYLASYTSRDRGAGRLGEVALVDATSRIGATGRTYGITLLDENAASHIAFGSGYSSTRHPDGARVNDSQIHVDVMIGAPEMEVTGYTMAGQPVPIVRDGLLQLR